MGLQSLGEALWALPTSVLAWGMIASGILAFVVLLIGPVAPYGR